MTEDILTTVKNPDWLKDRAPHRFGARTTDIGQGALISIELDGTTVATKCFVYEVADSICCAAVPQETSVSGLASVHSTSVVPVVRQHLARGTLILDEHIAYESFATSDLPADVCTDRANLVEHFVMAAAGLQPNSPVSASNVKSPFPNGAVRATLDGDPGTRELLHVGKKQPETGDMVNVRVFGGHSAPYLTTDVLVVSYAPGLPGHAQLKVPLDQANLENRALARGVIRIELECQPDTPAALLEELTDKVENEQNHRAFRDALAEREPNLSTFGARATALESIDRVMTLFARSW